jgi:hypothetical protein
LGQIQQHLLQLVWRCTALHFRLGTNQGQPIHHPKRRIARSQGKLSALWKHNLNREATIQGQEIPLKKIAGISRNTKIATRPPRPDAGSRQQREPRLLVRCPRHTNPNFQITGEVQAWTWIATADRQSLCTTIQPCR